MTTPARHYTATAIGLHWLAAVAIVGMLMLGNYMHDLPLTPTRLRLFNWHKWAGVVILGLSVLRLAWRLTHPPPPLPAGPLWQERAASAVHALMYLLFFAVPLVGWAYSSATGFPVVVFGVLPLPDLVAPDRALAEAIKPWHGRLAYALAALAMLHVAGALKHQFFDQDRLLQRMLPGRQ